MTSKLSIKSIVVGSGFGGIASALRLRALGHDVTLLEKLDSLGGRAQVFNINGFKHDAGPTVITAPFLFDELYSLFGKERKQFINFVSLDPWYRFYFSDNSSFDYRKTVKDTKNEISKFSKNDAEGYEKLLNISKKIFDIGFTELSHRDFSSFIFMLKQVPRLLRLKAYLTVSQLVEKYLKHPKIQKAFSIHPLLVGGNPYNTTSIYALIHYLERNWGVYFCMGGTGKIVDELRKLMLSEGIKIEYNVNIKKAKQIGNKIVSIESCEGKSYECDKLIFNGDPPTFYDEILEKKYFFRRKKFLPDFLTKYSMGMFVLFFGTKFKYDNVAHHTIWLGKRFKTLLSDIFDKKILAKDFSLYIHRPTATDDSFAPKNCDSFYVLCPVPNLKGNINWSNEGKRLKNDIVTALDKTLLPNLKKTICNEFWMTPETFKKKYRSKYGAGFSIAPIFLQSAWFRYHNKDPHIKNLYFAASGSHPGAGIPGVLSSAKVVENIIKEEMM